MEQLREEAAQYEVEIKKLRDENKQQNSTIEKQRATIEQMVCNELWIYYLLFICHI